MMMLVLLLRCARSKVTLRSTKVFALCYRCKAGNPAFEERKDGILAPLDILSAAELLFCIHISFYQLHIFPSKSDMV